MLTRLLLGGLVIPAWLLVVTLAPLPAQVERLRLGLPSVSPVYVPLMLGLREGHFRHEGLEVQIIQTTGIIAVKAMLAGEMHLTGAVGSTVEAAIRGVPVKVLFVGEKVLFDLIAQPEVKAFSDLRGKTVGSTGLGSFDHAVVREILARNGLDPDKDVVIINAGPPAQRYTALKARSVAAALLPLHRNLQAAGEGFTRLAFAGDYVEHVQAGITTADRVIQRQPQPLQRFIRALLRAHLLYQERRELALSMIMSYLDIKDAAFAQKVYEYHLRALIPQGVIPESTMLAIIERQKRTAKVTKEVTVAEVFDFNFARKAAEEVKATR